MTTNINEIIGNLPPERQAKIQARAAELIAEEETLQNLRQARERRIQRSSINQNDQSEIFW